LTVQNPICIFAHHCLTRAGKKQPDSSPATSAICDQSSGSSDYMKKKMCLLAALSLSLVSLVSCQQLQSRLEIREANDAYQKEEYASALKHYRKAREIAPTSFPDLDRMIGYSLIGLYVPEDTTPNNIKFADAAAGELRKYLTAKPNDLIAREALINLYLNADRTTDAINYFLEWLKSHPADLDAVRSVAQLYAKQGNFNESLNWYEKITLLDSKNPEAFYVYGVVCYEKVSKNPPADMAERMQIIERGKAALARATQLNPDYFEAFVYHNLLLRQQALVETDPVKQQQLIAEADAVRAKAVEVNNKRKAAAAKKS
jgi:tetratricopeptide (TPR) repeat protein